MPTRRFSLFSQAIVLWMMVVAVIFPVAPLRANPTGEQVVAGSASFDRSGSTLQITTSDRVIINWQDFSIGSGELTRFIQPSASSAALNRVISGNPSSILGTLESNGQVFLINPNGIMVGGGAIINCGSFIASTLDVSNEEFLAGGGMKFSGASQASVQNLGTIRATDGDVFLIARQVENLGTITADNGVVGMAAGSEVYLALAGADRLAVQLDNAPAGSGSGTGVNNAGVVQAAQAELKASGNVYGLAVNNGGVVRATGAVNKNGRVILSGGGGHVSSTGIIEARNHDGSGGAIDVTGGSVAIAGRVDASGAGNGGRIRIGGEYQGGKNLAVDELANAQHLSVARGTSITADGGAGSGLGNGGTVILWADQTSVVDGDISVRPGTEGGSGGFVEISSGDVLSFGGTVVTGRDGRSGTILFDPKNVTISAAGPDPIGDPFGTSPAANYTISAATLGTILSSPSSVTIQANNDITITSAITVNNGAGNGGDLTLQAGRSVMINASIITDNGNLTIRANEGVPAGVVNAQRDPGNAVIAMSPGTILDAGSANVHLVIGNGTGLSNNGSGGMTVDSINALNVWIQNLGPSAGGGIDRATPGSLITASTAAFEVATSGGGSVGNSINPLRIAINNVEAVSTSGGIWFDSPVSGTTLGGATLGALPGVNAFGPFEILAAGNIGQIEPVLVGGTTKLDAGANDIFLGMGAANDFVGSVTIVNANNATLNDMNGLSFGGGLSTIGGILDVTAGGNVTQSGGAIAAVAALFDVGASDVTLNGPNDFGSVGFPGSVNNVTINDINSVNLDGGFLLGSLTITANGDINQSNPLAVPVFTSLMAGAGNIDLSMMNDFNVIQILSANNVDLGDGNLGINLDASTITGDLMVTSMGGDIFQSGGLSVGGITAFDTGGTYDINLTGYPNSFAGPVFVIAANNVSLESTSLLDFGWAEVYGGLNVTAGGDIIQSGEMVVSGPTVLDAGPNSIFLTDPNNDFSSVGVLSADWVFLNDLSGITLDGVMAMSGLDVTAVGNIDQSGAPIVVTGNASFNPAGADVYLNTAPNDFISVAFNSANNVYVSDVNWINLEASSIGNSLYVTAGGDIMQSGTLDVGGYASLIAGPGFDINLGMANNFYGVDLSGNNASINDVDDIYLEGTLTGDLTVTAGGPIGTGMFLDVGGVASFDAGANDITLMAGDGMNSFGTVYLIGNNATVYENTSDLEIGGTILSGDLYAYGNGAITQLADLDVMGTATFGTSGGDVILTNPLNDFGAVAFSGAGNATVYDVNALNLGGLTLSGGLTINTGGPVDFQSVGPDTLGSLDVTSAGGGITDTGGNLTILGMTTLTANGGGDITLDGANDFNTVSVLAANNVNLADPNNLDFGVSSISGNLSVMTVGAITQTGALTVGGVTQLDATPGSDVTLGDGMNDFSTLEIVGANNVSLHDGNSINLGPSSISGNLGVIADNITQSGAITVIGATTLDSMGFDTTLANPVNSFVGGVSILSANNVTLGNSIALTLDTSNVANSLTVNAVGVIGQIGSLTIGGVASFDSAGNDVILVNPANDFNAVAFPSANDVTLNDVNGVTLDTSALSGSLSVMANGIINQGGALNIAGTSTFTSGGSPMSLGDAGNLFTGDVALNGGDTILAAGSGIALGPTAISGNLNVTVSGGSITQTSALSISGLATFNAGAGSISLGAANSFGTLGVNGASATVNTSGGVDVGVSSVSGTYSLTTGGAITQSGGVTAGLLTLNSGGPITMTAGNSVAILGNVTRGGAFSFYNAGSINIAGGFSAGALGNSITIQSGGDITLDPSSNFTTTGLGNDVILAAGGNFTNNSGSITPISTSGGGRFLIYSTDPSLNALNGMLFTFEEPGVAYPTPPSTPTGDGFMYSGIVAPPPPPEVPPQTVTDFTVATSDPLASTSDPTTADTGTGGTTVDYSGVVDTGTMTSDYGVTFASNTDAGGITDTGSSPYGDSLAGSSSFDSSGTTSEGGDGSTTTVSSADGTTTVTTGDGTGGDGSTAGDGTTAADGSATGDGTTTAAADGIGGEGTGADAGTPGTTTASSEPIGSAPGDQSVPAGGGMVMGDGGSSPLDGGQIPQSLQQGLDPQVQGDLQSAITSIDW